MVRTYRPNAPTKIWSSLNGGIVDARWRRSEKNSSHSACSIRKETKHGASITEMANGSWTMRHGHERDELQLAGRDGDGDVLAT